MSTTVRQKNLFAAEDWTKIYQAFTQVNFTAYDFNTIRLAMVDYIKTNYPEDFNDYIDSSEFIAIIDLLAYLGQSLAFRMDLNTRENFLDTAERRDSILKLAKMLSYTPRRNLPARGLLKLMAVQTNDDVFDSGGTNLSNISIKWNDANNPDWFEQFVLILNNAFIQSNSFGFPIQNGTFNGIDTQVYRFNNIPSTPGTFPFSATVDNFSLPFEVVNLTFDESTGFDERAPDPNAAFHIAYTNDGNGNSSQNTGFFAYFKQGNLQFSDFNLTIPFENRVINVDTNNINEFDVWVQSIDSLGNVQSNWTKIPALVGTNVIYNQIQKNIRNVFTVETLDNDQINLRFGDGRFGTVPIGLLRSWYRVSANLNYIIKSSDMQNINLTIPYINAQNLSKEIVITLSLQSSVFNAGTTETDAQVAQRANQVYYTQNRMVNGEDYNIYPLNNSQALKVIALNRTYGGHNRYIDINDPTGSYQNTNVFATDGLLYKNYDYSLKVIAANTGVTPDDLIINVIQPFIESSEFINYMYESYKKIIFNNPIYNVQNFYNDNGLKLIWNMSSNSLFSTTGRFVLDNGQLVYPPVPVNAPTVLVGQNSPALTPPDLIGEGSLIKFAQAGWVSVSNIIDQGGGFQINGEGDVRLDETVTDGDEVLAILPPFRTTLNQTEVDAMRREISNNRNFGIYYDYTTQTWRVIEPPAGQSFDLISQFDITNILKSWLIVFQISTTAQKTYTITARGLKYIFESDKTVRFFFVDKYKTYDLNTGKLARDQVKILKINTTPEYELWIKRAKAWIPYQTYTSTNWATFDDNLKDTTGDFVIYNETLYKCIKSHTASAFFELNASDWLAVTASFKQDYYWDLINNFEYEDGYIEPRRVEIAFSDNNADGIPDDPEQFDEIVFGNNIPDNPPLDNIIFEQQYTDFDGYNYFKPLPNIFKFEAQYIEEAIAAMDMNYLDFQTRYLWVDGQVAYCRGMDDTNTKLLELYIIYNSSNTYLTQADIPGNPVTINNYLKTSLSYPSQYTAYLNVGDAKIPSQQTIGDPTTFANYVGRSNLTFQWNHVAPPDQRIDPAITNIIDIYVLLQDYDTAIRQWVAAGSQPQDEPVAPTSFEIRNTFIDLENVKMASDQIVWHPVRYKFLFGTNVEQELQSQFIVVRLPNPNLSDGEIKSSIINLINNYFSVVNWDFGETFYFSELAAFIHQQLATSIASIHLVPLNDQSHYGDLQQIPSDPDQIFISIATVNDIQIVSSLTDQVLRVGS